MKAIFIVSKLYKKILPYNVWTIIISTNRPTLKNTEPLLRQMFEIGLCITLSLKSEMFFKFRFDENNIAFFVLTSEIFLNSRFDDWSIFQLLFWRVKFLLLLVLMSEIFFKKLGRPDEKVSRPDEIVFIYSLIAKIFHSSKRQIK